jgi:endonuclease YncB( thermonuclease family)
MPFTAPFVIDSGDTFEEPGAKIRLHAIDAEWTRSA